MGVVLKVLVKNGQHWEYASLKGDPNQTENLHHGHFGDMCFEDLPHNPLVEKHAVLVSPEMEAAATAAGMPSLSKVVVFATGRFAPHLRLTCY